MAGRMERWRGAKPEGRRDGGTEGWREAEREDGERQGWKKGGTEGGEMDGVKMEGQREMMERRKRGRE